jgi:hypothetical protein
LPTERQDTLKARTAITPFEEGSDVVESKTHTESMIREEYVIQQPDFRPGPVFGWAIL